MYDLLSHPELPLSESLPNIMRLAGLEETKHVTREDWDKLLRMKPLLTRPFIDLVERPDITLGGRFLEEQIAPVTTYTPEQIKQMKLAPMPPDGKLHASNRLAAVAGYRFREHVKEKL